MLICTFKLQFDKWSQTLFLFYLFRKHEASMIQRSIYAIADPIHNSLTDCHIGSC